MGEEVSVVFFTAKSFVIFWRKSLTEDKFFIKLIFKGKKCLSKSVLTEFMILKTLLFQNNTFLFLFLY